MSDYNFVLQKNGLRVEAVDYGDGKDGGQGFRLLTDSEEESHFVGHLGPNGLSRLCELVHSYLTGGGEEKPFKGELKGRREKICGFVSGAIMAGALDLEDM